MWLVMLLIVTGFALGAACASAWFNRKAAKAYVDSIIERSNEKWEIERLKREKKEIEERRDKILSILQAVICDLGKRQPIKGSGYHLSKAKITLRVRSRWPHYFPGSDVRMEGVSVSKYERIYDNVEYADLTVEVPLTESEKDKLVRLREQTDAKRARAKARCR